MWPIRLFRRWRMRRRERAILLGAYALVGEVVRAAYLLPVNSTLTDRIRRRLETGLSQYYAYHWPDEDPKDMFVVGEVAVLPMWNTNGSRRWGILATVYARGIPRGKMWKYTYRFPDGGEG